MDGRALLKCLIVLFACILRFCLRISRSRVLIKKILLHSKVRVPALTSKFFASRSSIEIFFTGWGGCRERNMPKFCFCSLYTRTYRYEGEGHTDNDVLVFSLKIGFPFKAKSCEMILYSRNFSLFRFLFVFRKHFVWHVSLPSFFAKCLIRNFLLQNLYRCYIFGTVFAVIWYLLVNRCRT